LVAGFFGGATTKNKQLWRIVEGSGDQRDRRSVKVVSWASTYRRVWAFVAQEIGPKSATYRRGDES